MRGWRGASAYDETADVHRCADGCTLIALASCSWAVRPRAALRPGALPEGLLIQWPRP